MGRLFRRPPPQWLGWLLAVGLVTLWSFIRLVLFAGQAFPLTFVVPLLLGVWTLSRRMVWAMAAAFLAVATLEFALLMPDFSQGVRLSMWVATAVSVLVGATVVHLIILLRLGILASLTRLQKAHEQITAQHEALETQADELAQQNEELAQQRETLTHQAERLAQQAEELEIQNEALQAQSEETESLNAELDQRERLLQLLLEATRLQAGEESVLRAIAAAAADIVGELRGLVVVCERRDEGFAVRAAVDETGAPVALAEVVCPTAMSELALQERRTAALADASLRPDLMPAPAAGRPPFQSLLAAPFIAEGVTRGTITALSVETREWTAEQFRLMEWLAGQAGRALESVRLQAALRESEERFRLMADELPLMVWVVDSAGRVTFVNRMYCDLLGATLAEDADGGWQRRLHPDDAAPYVEALKRALEERTPLRRRVRVRSADGDWRWIDSVAVPRFAGDGAFLGMLGSSPDITDIVLAEQVLRDAARRAQALASVDALIHSTLRLDETLDAILARSASAMACQVVHLLRRTEHGAWLTARAYEEPAAGMPADLTRREHALAEAAWRAAQERALTVSGPQPDVTPLTEHSAELASLAVPLIARDSFFGVIACHRGRAAEPFDTGRIDVARRLAASLSLAMENARLYEEQREIAVTLQENFIHPLSQVPGVELAVAAQAAGAAELIGGDFHDAFRLPGGRVVVLIGDVSGKGVRASGMGETVRSAVRALSLVTPSAPLVLSHVNRLLLTEASENFASLLLLLLDTQTGALEIGSAGHPAPIRLHAGSVGSLAVQPGPPLGTFPWQYEATRLHLAPGDVLVAYTDGLTEARAAGRLFGETRVVERAGEIGGDDLGALVDGLRAAAVAYAGRVQDDLQVLAVRYLGPPTQPGGRAASVLRLAVPRVVSGLGDTRVALRTFLDDCAVDQRTVARVVLCVEEACANAIRHSGSPHPAQLEVRVSDDAVEVCVVDAGVGMDLAGIDLDRPPEPTSEGRRGLYLIRQYSDTMELSSDAGMVVRFTVRRERQRRA